MTSIQQLERRFFGNTEASPSSSRRGYHSLLLGIYFRDFLRTDAGLHTLIVGTSFAMQIAIWIVSRKTRGAFSLALACGVTVTLALYACLHFHNAFIGIAVFIGMGLWGHYSGLLAMYGFAIKSVEADTTGENQKDR